METRLRSCQSGAPRVCPDQAQDLRKVCGFRGYHRCPPAHQIGRGLDQGPIPQGEAPHPGITHESRCRCAAPRNFLTDARSQFWVRVPGPGGNPVLIRLGWFSWPPTAWTWGPPEGSPLEPKKMISLMVPKVGLEPTRGCPHWILNPARLPISPLRPRVLSVKITKYF